MRKTLFIIYFVFINILFFLCLFCILYEEVLYENIYLCYLPEEVVYPSYDLKTGMVDNASDVTFWSEWDHIPWYGIFSHYIAGYTTQFLGLLHCLALILLIPIGIFNISKALWKFWLILLIELLIGLVLFHKIIIHYW